MDSLRGVVDDLTSEREVISERFTHIEKTVSTLEPWIGADGQLRVRLERMEQAVLALIEDPLNPAASAERARAILTSIPAPQA